MPTSRRSKRSSGLIDEWFSDQVVADEEARVTTRIALAHFYRWLNKTHGFTRIDPPQFSKRMGSLGYPQVEADDDWYYVGIKLA